MLREGRDILKVQKDFLSIPNKVHHLLIGYFRNFTLIFIGLRNLDDKKVYKKLDFLDSIIFSNLKFHLGFIQVRDQKILQWTLKFY